MLTDFRADSGSEAQTQDDIEVPFVEATAPPRSASTSESLTRPSSVGALDRARSRRTRLSVSRLLSKKTRASSGRACCEGPRIYSLKPRHRGPMCKMT